MASAVAASRSGQDQQQIASSPMDAASLELVELASNPILEGVLGPNKDGRVRNPIPRKLKGKMSNKKGSFQVMSMEMNSGSGKKNEGNRDFAAERDKAARITSEATASRAAAAKQGKYVPPKKRIEDGKAGANRASPFGSREDQKKRARPLTPHETKYEQARLLTLLRSINPMTVVDQLCKAVAYFGGIPGAPPPEDGIFAESRQGESGAIFIGWCSEIFPTPSHDNTMSPPNHTNPTNGYGLPAPTWNLPQSLALVNTHEPHVESGQPVNPAVEQNTQLQQQSPATLIKLQPEEHSPNATSTSKRRRGRPKGSRNKGRDGVGGSSGVEMGNRNEPTGEQQMPQPIASSATTEKVSGATEALPTTTSDQTLPDQTLHYGGQQWQGEQQGNQVEAISGIAPVDELSPEERAVLEAFRNHGPQTTAVNDSTISTTPQTGAKRKRAPPKPKPNPPPVQTVANDNMQPVQDVSALPPATEGVGNAPKESVQWAAVETSTPAPPAKRQRKPKSSSTTEPPSRKKTASVVSSSTPPIAPSTILDSTASSQQSVPSTRPPAEGLEAHYERFANLQQQTARSITPTNLPQQQMRQHQKSSSVTQHISQQHQPPSQQTQQSHHAQSSTKHEDRSITPSTRAPSTMYNQHSQSTSYSQQYPTHQSAQQYGTSHQASPQMSNNSYRTSSSHTMAQASPQFSQAETSYRTDSPHTLAQPSPFPQTESNYRAATTHSIAQPSPPYSQAEAPYRSKTSLSLAPPSSYSSRSSQPQTQPSHQNHQNQYGHFQESSFMDLPTLDSLGHASGAGNTNVSMSMGSTGAYGQPIGGIGSRRSGSGSLYSTSSGLHNAYDTGASDLLRVSRSGSNTTSYGTASGISNSYDTGASEHEMRERLLRGLSRR